MLTRVDGFKWMEAVEWPGYQELPTGEKVKRMRMVGRSLTKFYQEELGLSLDKLAFNYIEMCTSNEESDVLRLFIAVMGILMKNE